MRASRLSAFPRLALIPITLLLVGGCDRKLDSGKIDSRKSLTPNGQTGFPPSAGARANPDERASVNLEVEVAIDFRDSQPAIAKRISLPAGATAFSALEALAGELGFNVQSTGAGETRFVVAIRDVANQGAKGDNWTYRVNDQLGDRSSGLYQLKAGDKVFWIFGKYP